MRFSFGSKTIPLIAGKRRAFAPKRPVTQDQKHSVLTHLPHLTATETASVVFFETSSVSPYTPTHVPRNVPPHCKVEFAPVFRGKVSIGTKICLLCRDRPMLHCAFLLRWWPLRAALHWRAATGPHRAMPRAVRRAVRSIRPEMRDIARLLGEERFGISADRPRRCCCWQALCK